MYEYGAHKTMKPGFSYSCHGNKEPSNQVILRNSSNLKTKFKHPASWFCSPICAYYWLQKANFVRYFVFELRSFPYRRFTCFIVLRCSRKHIKNIGFPRVFQTFFIHFHSKNNSISSKKMSLNKSRFQFQACVKQFQNCVIIFQTYFIDFRRFGRLIRPILLRIVNRRSNFVLCHLY